MASGQTGSVLERTVLKEGQIFLVADRAGDIKALNLEGHGLYYRDMRHLSLFELDITGTRLILLSASGELNFMSNLQFANDTLIGQDGDGRRRAAHDQHPPQSLPARRRPARAARAVQLQPAPGPADGALHRSARTSATCSRCAATSRATTAGARRDATRSRSLPDGVLLGYQGSDGVERRTHVTFDPPPTSVEIVNDRLRRLGPTEGLPGLSQWNDPRDDGRVVPPIAAAVFQIDAAADAGALDHGAHRAATRATRRRCRPSRRGAAARQRAGRRVRRHARLVRRVALGLDPHRDRPRAVRPAAAPRAAGPAPADRQRRRRPGADGWHPVVRRAVRSRQPDHLDADAVAAAVDRGRHAAVSGPPPGHARSTTSATSSPARSCTRYAWASWPSCSACRTARTTAASTRRRCFWSRWASTCAGRATSTWRAACCRTPKLRSAWMRDYGDLDGDGFLEYHSRSAEGIRNQGWKDSPDSASHRDGTIAEPPIALAEVQAYAFAAHREMAELYGRLGEPDKERAERQLAERTRQRFLETLAVLGRRRALLGDGSGRRQAPHRDGHVQPGPRAVGGPAARRRRAHHRRPPARRRHAVRLGHPHAVEPRAHVQPDELPQRLGLAARQRADRAGHEARWRGRRGARGGQPGVRGRAALSRLAPARAVVRLRPRSRATTRRRPSTRSRAARRPGRPAAPSCCCRRCSGSRPTRSSGVVRLRPVLPNWLGRVSFRKLRVAGQQVDFDVIREGHRVLVDVIDDGGLRIEIRQAEDESLTRADGDASSSTRSARRRRAACWPASACAELLAARRVGEQAQDAIRQALGGQRVLVGDFDRAEPREAPGRWPTDASQAGARSGSACRAPPARSACPCPARLTTSVAAASRCGISSTRNSIER